MTQGKEHHNWTEPADPQYSKYRTDRRTDCRACYSCSNSNSNNLGQLVNVPIRTGQGKFDQAISAIPGIKKAPKQNYTALAAQIFLLLSGRYPGNPWPGGKYVPPGQWTWCEEGPFWRYQRHIKAVFTNPGGCFPTTEELRWIKD